ncbi:MAG TPA: Os1348 family NHLP clan protein [Candidatus Limnocylindria bacterium]|nr:Os1348 family NHLP clan protein [Candidatus Limnocylindria bacterium]
MSQEVLRKVVQRSISDRAFRTQLSTDANAALRGYALTPEEIGALRNRDAGKLTVFGVDTRMSKMFLDPGSFGHASVIATEPRDSEPVWIGDNAELSAVQSPDAADRNLAYASAELLASGGVQSPDAIDRNLAELIHGDGELQP